MSGVRMPLLEVVEHDDAYGAAQPPERPLVQLGPDLRARPVDQQADGLAQLAAPNFTNRLECFPYARQVTHYEF